MQVVGHAPAQLRPGRVTGRYCQFGRDENAAERYNDYCRRFERDAPSVGYRSASDLTNLRTVRFLSHAQSRVILSTILPQ